MVQSWPTKALKKDFHALFAEFLREYPPTPAGQKHIEFYPWQRETGQQNYREIQAAVNHGDDITDLVLHKLIPYTDCPNNHERDVWIHIAPSITGDLKTKFERAGWTDSENWPQIAEAIFKFVSRCVENPEQLELACAEFQENPVTKGFQTGMVTPILNALRPDDFLVINNKSRPVINSLAGTNYGQKLADYAAINATGKELIHGLRDSIRQGDRPNLSDEDLFDMFCHWLKAVKKYNPASDLSSAGNPSNQDDERLSDDKFLAIEKADIPDFQTFLLPVLRQVEDGEVHHFRDVINAIAQEFHISDEAREERLPSGRYGIFDSRVGWAKTYLRKAGLLDYPKRATLQITDLGLQCLADNPPTINIDFLKQFPEFTNFLSNHNDNDEVESQEDLEPVGTEISYWIFQANPKFYDLPGSLDVLEKQTWVIRQHKADIHAGDRIFLWEAGSNAGILALAEILTEPEELPEAEEALSFFREGDSLEGTQLRVWFRVLQRLEQRIPKQILLKHPTLSSLSILRSPQQTNFAVTEEQAEALINLFESAKVEELQPRSLEDLDDAWETGNSNLIREPYEPPRFEAIAEFVQSQGLSLSDRTLRRYHLALQTRGFVILSGVSGTGKTWLTQVYADAVGADYCLVAVAPNWTSNEDLLGYWNPLDNTYRHTEFSRFLAAAAQEYEQSQRQNREAYPYHLVLDEMNLARVEYYFAKFLSAMELRQRDGIATIEMASNYHLTLPPNLVFIGTVNVDETTHSFADKVYDRAQLIELTIDRHQVETDLGEVPYRDTVLEIWDALHPVAPFAFRILAELRDYIQAGETMNIPWTETLDEQLVQKILPKLRGMDQRVGEALSQFLAIANAEQFPLSHQKAQTMQEMWEQHGVVSYF